MGFQPPDTARTPQTTNLIDETAIALMKPTSFLVNVARGGCVDELALIQALTEGRIKGAGIDVTQDEPLADASPLWDIKNVLITPHTGGDTHRYEDVVLDYLQDNLDRLWRGEMRLYNEII